MKEIHEEDLGDILREMPESETLLFASVEGQRLVIQMTPEGMQELIADSHSMCVYAMAMRPGVRYFMHHVEYTHFPPETPANDAYTFGMLKWQEMQWHLFIVPLTFRAAIEASAKIAKVRLVPDDFSVTVLSSEGMERFPIRGDNIFSVENESGSEVYGGLGADQDLYVEETMRIQKEFGP